MLFVARSVRGWKHVAMVGHRWWTSSPKTSVAECQGRTELSEALGGFDADRALIVAECLRDDRGPGEGCAF